MKKLIKKYKGKIEDYYVLIDRIDVIIKSNIDIDERLLISYRQSIVDYISLIDAYEGVIQDLKELKK